MQENTKVLNRNFSADYANGTNRNYQLIKNDIIELETDCHITSYSIMVNSICNNTVTQSKYIDDVSRDLEQAKRIFEHIALGDVPDDLLEELVQEIIG